MQKILKPGLALLSIALFMILALATGPDASTNTEVFIEECSTEDPATGSLKVFVYYANKSGMPIQASGSIFIVEQLVTDNIDCQFLTVRSVKFFNTGADGTFSYVHGEPYIHDNSSDLYRVEVIMDKTQEYEESKTPVQVQKYNIANFFSNPLGKNYLTYEKTHIARIANSISIVHLFWTKF